MSTTINTITSTSTSTTKSYFTPARPAPRPSSPLYTSPTQKKTMSIAQTYYLAHKARGKLSKEASRADHNLRLLVGHANLLDSLMLDLAQAEREQESWFNQTVRGASSSSSTPTPTQQEETAQKHIQWADTVVEDPEEDWQVEDASNSSDSDSDSDSYCSDSDSSDEDEYDEDGDVEMADAVALHRVASHSSTYVYHKAQPTISMATQEPNMEDEEAVEFEDDEEEDYTQLTLTRSPSHSHSRSSPPTPELDEDDSDSDEDELAMMPPSPPTPVVHQFTEKEREAIATTGYYPATQTQQPLSKNEFYDQGFYIPQRNPARLVSAISVY